MPERLRQELVKRVVRCLSVLPVDRLLHDGLYKALEGLRRLPPTCRFNGLTRL